MDFTLIDLISQRQAFQQHLQGKSKKEVLDFLASHGKINKFEIGEKELFSFLSFIGIEDQFFFNKINEIIFIGKHTTFT